MHVSAASIMLSSEDRDRLRAFYRDIVQLPPMSQYGPYAFEFGGAGFNITEHSETRGPAKDPTRVILNFFVDDVAAEEARLEAQGVTFIRKQGKEEWGGIISTFLDPDGNYCQLIEYHES